MFISIKKVVFTTALGFGIVSFASAQTNLITNFDTGGVINFYGNYYGPAGNYSAGVATPSGAGALNGVTNPINLIAGHTYLLSFTINGNSVAQASGGFNRNQSVSFYLGTNTGSQSLFINGRGSQEIALQFAGFGSNPYSVSNLMLRDFSAQVISPFMANTQQSLVNTSQALQSTYTLQNSVLANSFTYDCSLFDKNNICISAGGRNTAVSMANGLNNTSGLLIGAYRALQTVRVGAYIDQNLSVNNAGSTVSLGNNTPLIGLFGAWNERQDGTGSELKISAAYGQKNTTITRQVVGMSEAGSGSSQLNSQGFQVLGKHGYELVESIVISPYAGIRYTQNNMGGYTESASSAPIAPLTYGALNTKATTALVGLGASYRGILKTNLFASAGVETDTNTSNGSYSATGVSGLTPINFNPNPVKTRPTATVGATYDIEKNQRIGITGIYRQEPFQAVSTTTVMATYTVGL